MVSLAGLEEVLAERAQELGVELRLGTAVTDVTQTDDGASVHVGDQVIQAKWVVGCDGGRSTVRKRAGFEFVGTDPEFTGTVAMADFADPEKLQPGWNITPTGMYVNGPLPGRLGIVDFDGGASAREETITLESFQETLRRVSGTDITVTALHLASRYTDNARQATTYRKGRILLAGDAAHVHSPLGGQGLNLGIGDAMNLGWKLASVIKGWTPESLLDTYTEERRPVAEAVLANTLAQAAIMRPDPQSSAMRDVVAKLMQFDDVNAFMGEMMSGLSIRYDLGSELDNVGRLIGDKPISHGDADVSLYDFMQDGMGVLLDASTERKASRLVAASTQRIRCLAVDTGPSLLIRPDACIAWVCEKSSTNGLEDALRRWFIPSTART